MPQVSMLAHDESSSDSAAPLPSGSLADEERARANLYTLLAALLIGPPAAGLLEVVARLEGSDTAFGRAFRDLAARAAGVSPARVEDEYTRLYYGQGAGGELTPCASFYRTGFVYEKPLADLRDDLARLGIRPSGRASEPEDHIACLLDVMGGLIAGSYGAPVDLEGQRKFFDAHLAPWAGTFFADLEKAENADFYRPVAAVGRLLMATEGEAFAIEA